MEVNGFAPFRFKLIGKPLYSAVTVADLHKALGNSLVEFVDHTIFQGSSLRCFLKFLLQLPEPGSESCDLCQLWIVGVLNVVFNNRIVFLFFHKLSLFIENTKIVKYHFFRA